MKQNNLNQVFTSDRGGDITKDWYIFYYWLNPETRKVVRTREALGINRIHSVKERREALYLLKTSRQKLLDSGWTPNQQFDPETLLEKAGLMFTTFEEAVQKVIEQKRIYLKPTSFVPFNSRCAAFLEYLRKNGLERISVKSVTKKHIIGFLDDIVQERQVSMRTRNNILTDIRTMFSTMCDLELIDINPAERIKKMRTESESNQTYTDDEVIRIFEWTNQHDPQLGMFCKFIAYDFIRPVELTRLQIKHIDFENRVIHLPANTTKTGLSATIPMIDFRLSELEQLNLHQYPKEYYLFSAKGKPDARGTTRDFFTNRFSKLKKALGFGLNHTMYGLKHTFVCHLLKEGVPEGEIRKRTRHKTASAFHAYIKSYNMEQHNDISSYFKLRPDTSSYQKP